MPLVREKELIHRHHFRLSIPGLTTVGYFSVCTGLEMEVEVFQYAEGGNNEFVHKLPKGKTWPNLVLKRGLITDSNVLFEWFAKCSGEGLEANGDKLDLRNGAVELRDAAGKTVRKWEFTGAFPLKWEGPKLAASAKDVATEQLEVCHCGFKPSK